MKPVEPLQPGRRAAGRFPRTAALLLLACSALTGPAHAWDDRYTLTADGVLSSDDNLTRTGVASAKASDVVRTLRLSANAVLPDGPRNYSLGASVSQVSYARFTQQNYTAYGFNAGFSQAFGRDVQLDVALSESQALLPLNNFRSLVRDLVSNRSESLQLRENLDARWSVVERVAFIQSTNSLGSLNYNDQDSTSASVGLDYRTPTGSGGTLSLIRSGATYPHLATLPGVPDPSYKDVRLQARVDWPVTPITTLHADVAAAHHSYNQLPAQNTNGLVGSVSADLTPGGPWSMGVLASHELGGTGILASRVLTSDTLEWHSTLAWTSLWSSNLRVAAINRHYSVDQPGFPAHQEATRQWSLDTSYQPRRWLTFSLAFAGEAQRAQPDLFAFVDHRLTLTATVQP